MNYWNLVFAVFLSLIAYSLSFKRTSLVLRASCRLRMNEMMSDKDGQTPKSIAKSFSEPFQRVAIGVSSAAFLSALFAVPLKTIGASGPIVVLGSGGKTGKLIVEVTRL